MISYFILCSKGVFMSLCRGSKASPSDRRPLYNPVALVVFVIVMFILAFVLLPRRPGQLAASLSSSEISAFKELSGKIAEVNTAIVAEERALANLTRGHRNSLSATDVRRQYVHLAALAHMKACRYESARLYNLAASKISPNIPIDDEFRRYGLPMGIQ